MMKDLLDSITPEKIQAAKNAVAAKQESTVKADKPPARVVRTRAKPKSNVAKPSGDTAKRRVRVKKKSEQAPVMAQVKSKTTAKKVTTKDPLKVEGKFKLAFAPRGKALFTYTLAVFSVLGGFTSSRKTMDKPSLRTFYASNTAIKHHTDNGNMEEASGGVRLTVTGWNYFNGRLTGSNVAQKVDQPEMEALINGINTGVMTKTARFDASTKWIKIGA